MKCDNPDCNNAEMKVVLVRDDGCRMFVCPVCEQMVGEETMEWFEQQRKCDEENANRALENCEKEGNK